jgi:hypothetical protein
MSPEQALGKEPDARADIYALGINLFEMLAGHPPFNGQNHQEVLQHQLNTPLPALPASSFEDLSAVNPILQRACAKDPAQRYASMAELATALGTLSTTTQRSFSLPPDSEKETGTGTLVLKPKSATPLEDRLVKTAQPPKTPEAPSGRPWAVLGLGVAVLIAGALVAPRVLAGLRASGGDHPRSRESVPEARPFPAGDPRANTTEDPGRRHLLAEEIWLKANAEFQGGNLDGAQTILETVPPEEKTASKVESLREQIGDARDKLGRARGLSARGDCASAIRVYDLLLRAYPSLAEARHERDRCAHMLPPNLTE